MPEDRIYLLNHQNHMEAVRKTECPDDDAALAQDATAIDGHAGGEA